MCSGLATVPPFFGSTKNTRARFVAGFFVAGFFAWALTKAPEPATMATITAPSSTSCLFILISDLLFCICSRGPTRLASLAHLRSHSKPPAAAFRQTSGGRIQREDARRDGSGHGRVRRCRHDRRAAARRDLAHVPAERDAISGRQIGRWMFQQQNTRVERQRARQPR